MVALASFASAVFSQIDPVIPQLSAPPGLSVDDYRIVAVNPRTGDVIAKTGVYEDGAIRTWLDRFHRLAPSEDADREIHTLTILGRRYGLRRSCAGIPQSFRRLRSARDLIRILGSVK